MEGIGAAVIIKQVVSDNEGNFNFSFNAKSTRHYNFSVSPDHTANLLNPGPGLVLSKDIISGETNNVQLYVQTYSYVQTKIIQDMSYDSMYLEFQHVNIDSKNAQGMYVDQVSDGNLTETPSGLRVYKTIKYLNGAETISIDTMDFEPMQTYNLEFHY